MEVFRVNCIWGRINVSQQELTKEFKTRLELISFLDEKLREKQRKGYKIVKLSENFPYIRQLKDFPWESKNYRQLRLF